MLEDRGDWERTFHAIMTAKQELVQLGNISVSGSHCLLLSQVCFILLNDGSGCATRARALSLSRFFFPVVDLLCDLFV